MFRLFHNFIANIPGMPYFGNEQRVYINAVGLVSINGTHVTQSTRVAGSLSCSNAELNTLNVQGSSILNSSTIHGIAKFVGAVRAQNTTFQSTTEITSNEGNFNDCTMQNITVKQQNPPSDETLFLDNTTVNGNVTFESARGRIVLSNNAAILGDIIGAEIVNNAPQNRM